MSTNKSRRSAKSPAKRSGKRERYIQPSILLGLLQGSSYGYELIQTIPKYGFLEGQPSPGIIYRHLRGLERDGLVASEWETAGSGPAKRMYRITDEGAAVLELWIDYMARQARHLKYFIQHYHAVLTGSK